MRSDENDFICRKAAPSASYDPDTCSKEYEVWVTESAGRIISRLHLIRCKLNFAGTEAPGVCIAGAATDKEMRGKGAVTMMLKRVFAEEYSKGLPFAYLMPPDEGAEHAAVGEPSDFRLARFMSGAQISLLPFPGQTGRDAEKAFSADLSRRKPAVIMGRVISVKHFLEMVGRAHNEITEDVSLWLYITDRWIPGNNGLWSWSFGRGRSSAQYMEDDLSQEASGYESLEMNMCSSSAASADAAADAGVLIQWLFSYKTTAELIREGMIMLHGDVSDKIDMAPVSAGIYIKSII